MPFAIQLVFGMPQGRLVGDSEYRSVAKRYGRRLCNWVGLVHEFSQSSATDHPKKNREVAGESVWREQAIHAVRERNPTAHIARMATALSRDPSRESDTSFRRIPRQADLRYCGLGIDVNADRNVGAAVLAIRDISRRADLQRAFYRRILVDSEGHRLRAARSLRIRRNGGSRCYCESERSLVN